MTPAQNAVLADFTPVQLAKPVPQRFALEISAYGFARAQCRHENVTDDQTFRKVHQQVKEKFERYAVSASQIKRRQLVFFPKLSDIRFRDGHLDLAEPDEKHLKVYDINDNPRGADITTRHQGYQKVVGKGLGQLFDPVESSPDDIIHVTCSGYLAPSPVQRMVAERNWFSTTVTHSYHMGCYGAFPAIRMAHGFLSSSQASTTQPKERIDIVHTELLSAHNNITDLSAGNIIAMTLFSDGLIRYSLYSEQALRQRGLRGLKILAFDEHLLPDSAEEMTWVPGSHSFEMTLTPMVPVVIKRHVKSFVESLLRRAGIDFDRDKERLSFAIHPGGPKIVEHVQEVLGLRDDQIAISLQIFRENGNMSSATIPHILKETLSAIDVGTRVVALAFGPGLTTTGLVLEKV